MTTPTCIKCELGANARPKVRRYGRYYRPSDSKWVQRFRCSLCGRSFSSSTFDICRWQKKRRKNQLVCILLSGGMSQTRVAKVLHLNRKTVTRIMLIESLRSEFRLKEGNLKKAKASMVQFDDLETFEHTKCKPLSVTLAVEQGTRRILGLEVSSMPAKGRLADKAKNLYGPRRDGRKEARRTLFRRISTLVNENMTIKSDSNPHYPKSLKKAFPGARHIPFKGKQGSLTGQGELKKVKFDPLFSLNHTCAMLRANVNRLFRKTWCTTKRADHLYAHLVIYADYHNHQLIPQSEKRRTALQQIKGRAFTE